MAGARRKRNEEWTATGSFVNKPQRGWLHPDDQLLPDAGVCYGVRYIGCMEVKVSMKTLDFATRTAVAKESIARVSEAGGLKGVTKRKKEKKLAKYIGANPLMHMAGSNVNLTITTDSLSMMVMETGEIIAEHQMPGISFASGGDPDTMDFVAYVAKDQVNGRVCYVLECGGGLAQDVITTIGQAFELRFKQYLESRPVAVDLNKKTNSAFGEGDSWGNEPDYYNDRPGAQPPASETEREGYSAPSNIPAHVFKSMRDEKEAVYDNREKDLMSFDEPPPNVYDNPRKQPVPMSEGATAYDNPRCMSMMSPPHDQDNPYDNKGAVGGAMKKEDPFDMEPFCNTLPRSDVNGTSSLPNSPEHEDWFHGKLSRPQAESLLRGDGDFLVRESTNTTGQYVLSGMHDGKVKHLLLVDPEGIVRTKDKQFDSVSHLVNYHMTRKLPICSQDSELELLRPVIHSKA